MANEMASANETIIHPRRLVMVQTEDNCMFCPEPKGQTASTYVDLMNKLGYICCVDCQYKMDEAVNAFNKRVSMSRVAHLQDKEFCIRRSSGQVEGGWRFMLQPIQFDTLLQTELIMCSRCHLEEGKDIVRWCILEDILKLNPLLSEE